MNKYSYEEIEIGFKESFAVVITEDMQKTFCVLTGDVNPLHCDEKFATGSTGGGVFTGRVVYGMLIASFCSTLAGVYLPGEHCLLHSVETNFIKPVYIGDALVITGTVKEKNEFGRQIVIKVVITNQDEKIVLRGIIKAGCLK